MWCEFCRDHYDDHFDEEGNHRVGLQYGYTGYEMACMNAFERIAERIASDSSPLAAELRAMIGGALYAKLSPAPTA